jgi:hypothetical protein
MKQYEMMIKRVPDLVDNELEENKWLHYWDEDTCIATIDRVIQVLEELKTDVKNFKERE